MKKTICMFLITVLMAVMLCTVAMGDSNIYAITLGEKGASLRDAPAGTKIGSVHGKTYLEVYDEQGGWYLVCNNGMSGWVSDKQVAQRYYNNTPNPNPNPNPNPAPGPGRNDNAPYIRPMVYGLDSRHDSISWVQTQLKATGRWYQGDQWKVTGHLGKHTMSEIKSFMNYMGYPYHTGVVDQDVIDALCDYLNGNFNPVVTAKPKPNPTPTPASSSEVILCHCGGTKTESVIYGGYTCDADGHCRDTQWVYTCTSCGDQTFSGAPGEGTWYPHSFNSEGKCTVCGYQRGH